MSVEVQTLRLFYGDDIQVTGLTDGETWTLYPPDGEKLSYTVSGGTLTVPWTDIEPHMPQFYTYETRITLTLRGGSQSIIRVIYYNPGVNEWAYTTPEEVMAYLGLEPGTIDYWWLMDRILERMDYVDQLTKASWNGRRRLYRFYYDMANWKPGRWFWIGSPIILAHRCVRKIVKIEVFFGSHYEDWTYKLELARGRGDAWLDEYTGTFYWQHFPLSTGGKELHIWYEYGCDELPGQVKELTMLLVARDVLVNERRVTQLPVSDGMSLLQQLEYFNRRIDELKAMLTGMTPAVV